MFTMLFNKAHALLSICCNTLNSEELSIASCSSINKPDLKPLDTRAGKWVGGEKGEASPG